MSFLLMSIIGLTWSTGANASPGVAYPGGDIFVDGSGNRYLAMAYGATSTSSMTNAHRWYDPASDSWINKASAPTPNRYDLVMTQANYNGSPMLFTFGGSDGGLGGSGVIIFYSDCHRYDPSTDSWSSIATLPNNLLAEAQMGKAIRDTVYVFGGYWADYNAGTQTARTDHYAYIPSSNTWISRASLPEGKAEAAVAKAVNPSGDTVIYVFGGAVDFDDTWGTPIYSNSSYYYDPGTDSWNGVNALPGDGRNGAACATLRNMIYIIGGFHYNASGGYDLTRVDVYDPLSNTYSTGPALPAAHDGGVAAAVDMPFDYGASLVSPGDGDTVKMCTPYNVLLDWDVQGPVKIVYSGEGTASGVTNYTYLLRTDITDHILRYTQDPSFSTYTEATGFSATQYTASLPNVGWWYWTVRAVDEFGDSSAWSDTFAFYLADTCATGINEGSGVIQPGLRLTTVNPSGHLDLSLISPDASAYTVQAYSPAGALLQTKRVEARTGENHITMRLSISGAVIVVLRTKHGIIDRKLVIIR